MAEVLSSKNTALHNKAKLLIGCLSGLQCMKL